MISPTVTKLNVNKLLKRARKTAGRLNETPKPTGYYTLHYTSQ